MKGLSSTSSVWVCLFLSKRKKILTRVLNNKTKELTGLLFTEVLGPASSSLLSEQGVISILAFCCVLLFDLFMVNDSEKEKKVQ
jgi:hypothetical protein